MNATDPVTLAREVLEACQRANADAPTFVERYRRIADRNAITDEHAPTLARAVIQLTDKVERMEALADRLDREASEYLGRLVHSQAGDRIRAALNGDADD